MNDSYIKDSSRIIDGIKNEEFTMYWDNKLEKVLWKDSIYTKENGDYIKYRDALIHIAMIGSTKFYTDDDGIFKKSGRGRISKNTQIELDNFTKLVEEL